MVDGLSLDVGGSIGIAIYPTHGDDFAGVVVSDGDLNGQEVWGSQAYLSWKRPGTHARGLGSRTRTAIRENYLVSLLDTNNEHGLVTEVCWPVLSTRGEKES